jgi:aminoglycoside phosphotransferase (APT) family kinase protein
MCEREAVWRILGGLLNAPCHELVTYESYKPSQVWSCGELVLKINPAGDIRTEAWALRQARAAGVPVPMIVAEGADAALPGQHYVVMTFVAGDELPVHPVLLQELGGLVRRLHTIEAPGFGSLHAPRASWFDWLAEQTDAWLAIHDEPAVRELLLRWQEPLQRVPCRLLHGDIQQSHVRVRNGAITGMFDFESALGGDPMWDLAGLCSGIGTRDSFAVADQMLPDVLHGYGAIDRTCEPLYRVLVSLAEVVFNMTHDWTEWVPSAREVLHERIHEAQYQRR